MMDKNVALLVKKYNLGCLERSYYDGQKYAQPYSAEDRLLAGQMLYADFLAWRKGTKLVRNYDLIKIDGGSFSGNSCSLSFAAERFRRALNVVPKSSLAVVYKIVLTEEDIKAPKEMSVREVLYFNDEIKGLLCRGLDALCRFYAEKSKRKL